MQTSHCSEMQHSEHSGIPVRSLSSPWIIMKVSQIMLHSSVSLAIVQALLCCLGVVHVHLLYITAFKTKARSDG